MTREEKKAKRKLWLQTPAGREYVKRHRRRKRAKYKEKRRVYFARYFKTPRGREVARRALRKYNASEKGVRTRKNRLIRSTWMVFVGSKINSYADENPTPEELCILKETLLKAS